MLTRRLVQILALPFLISTLMLGFVDRVSAGWTSVAIGALNLNRSSVASGDALTAQVSVSNIGKATTTASVSFWLVPSEQAVGSLSSSPLVRTSVGMLQAGKTVAVAATLPVSLDTLPGTYRVIATVQTTKTDRTTSDNTASATVQVYSPTTSSTSSTSTLSSSTTSTSLVVATSPMSTTSSSTSTSSSTPCDYYASPNGAADGRTSSTPFTLANFWPLAAAGKTLCLLNGTYQGSGSMLVPPPGVSGTSGNPIAVKALNDGGVLIDGQGARLPLYLNGNQWWVIEGLNVANSSGDAVAIYAGSNNNIFRRICAWHAGGSNNHVWDVWNSSNNLFEDICGFGNGRTILTEYSDNGSTSGNIYRRFWARWEGWTAGTGGPYLVWQMNYGTSGNYVIENGIGVWAAGRPTGGTPSSVIKVLSNSGVAFNNGANGYPAGGRWLGTLVYGYNTASLVPEMGWLNNVSGGRITLQDVVVLDSGFNFVYGPIYASCTDSVACPNAVINRLTAVRGSVASTVGPAWSVTGFNEAASLSGRNPYDTGTSEASLCYRYANGSRTTVPLWPWPMDDRIKSALATAGSAPLAGTAGNGYAANTVTSETVSKLGAIPAGCGG